MYLLDLIFGKKETFSDPVLGTVVSERIRSKSRDKVRSWYAGYLVPGALEKTAIILNGNHLEPNAVQLDAVKGILKNLDGLWKMVDEKLKSESESIEEQAAAKKWQSIFFLGAIYPIDDNWEPLFEIYFDTISQEASGYMAFNYINETLETIEVSIPKG